MSSYSDVTKRQYYIKHPIPNTHQGAGVVRGESARLPPVWPGFDSWTRRHMWVEFVVGSLLAPRGFSLGTPVFPSPPKPTFLNSNSIWNARTRINEFLRALWCYVGK